MTNKTTPIPRLQPINFFSIGNKGSTGAFRSSFRISGSDIAVSFRGSGGQRGLDAREEQPGNDQSDPDHEAEQADEIDRGQFADALLPQLLEVGENADGKEGQ